MVRVALFAAVAAALIASSAACRTPARGRADQPAPQPPIIELRLAQDRPGPGFVPMVLPARDTVYVAEKSVVSDDGIEHVRVDTTGGFLVLDSRLSPAAAERLLAATVQVVGPMRLAVLIQSRLANAPPIRSAVGVTRRIHIGVPISPQSADARAIAARVAARWPQ